MTTRNEAAERLSRWAPDPVVSPPEYLEWLQTKREALAAERRTTVERIRARVNASTGKRDLWDGIWDILDEEAAR